MSLRSVYRTMYLLTLSMVVLQALAQPVETNNSYVMTTYTSEILPYTTTLISPPDDHHHNMTSSSTYTARSRSVSVFPTTTTSLETTQHTLLHETTGTFTTTRDAETTRPVVPPISQPSMPPFSRPSVPPQPRPGMPPFSRPSTPPLARPGMPPFSRPSVPPLARPGMPPISRPGMPPFGGPAGPPFSIPSRPPVVTNDNLDIIIGITVLVAVLLIVSGVGIGGLVIVYRCRAARRRVGDRTTASTAAAARGSGKRRNTPWHPYHAEPDDEHTAL